MAAPANHEFDLARELAHRQTQDENVRLREVNRRQQQRLEVCQQQLEVCHEKYGEDCHEPYVKPDGWLKLLRENEPPRDRKILNFIFRVSCRQYNMSSVYRKNGLYFTPPDDEAVIREPVMANPEAGFRPNMSFPFSHLLNGYPDIVRRIAVYTMSRHTAISVVARFDVHDRYPPREKGLDKKTGPSYRFHYGGRACAINSAPLPKDVLAPILVCRDWHEIFSTAFYFVNKFNFESLGEFEIFFRMMPLGGMKRIRDIGITWIGSRMETSNPKRKGPRYDKSRHGMHNLNKLINLRSLEISIDESSSARRRRNHETDSKKGPLLKSTKTHENFTGNRSLRTMRGMDAISQLRGIKRFEIYDYNQCLPNTRVNDQAFVEDMRRQIYSPKNRAQKTRANLKTLRPLLKSKGPNKWVMSEKVREIVHGIFDMFPGEAEDDAGNEMARNAGDDSDDDDSDDGGDDYQNDTDYDDDDGPDGDDNQNPDDDDSDSDSDDAPDQGGNASRATPVVAEAGNLADGGGDHNWGEDDNIPMDGSAGNQGRKSGDNSDDDNSDLIGAARLSPINPEEDDELRSIRAAQSPTQATDLSQLPDLEDPDTPIPSIEDQETEMKSEDQTGAEGMDGISILEERPGLRRRSSSPFGAMSPRRGQTEQSSLFVRQSPSSRRSVSSFFGYFGSPNSENKRRFEDMNDEDDDDADNADGPPTLRRRLSNMTVEEDEMQK